MLEIKNLRVRVDDKPILRGIDPTTGHNYDDTKRYIEAAPIEPEARYKIYEGNARRVYPRLDAALKAKGLDRKSTRLNSSH